MMEVRGRVLPPPKLQYGGRVSSMSGQVSVPMFVCSIICFLTYFSIKKKPASTTTISTTE